jgi:hypothetical protein
MGTCPRRFKRRKTGLKTTVCSMVFGWPRDERFDPGGFGHGGD